MQTPEQTVEVELSTGPVDVEIPSQSDSIATTKTDQPATSGSSAVEVEVASTETSAAPAGPSPAEALAEMQVKLDDMNRRAEADRKARDEAEQLAMHAAAEAEKSRTTVFEAQVRAAKADISSITNALAAEEAEAEQAERALAHGIKNQDAALVAKAQRALSRAEVRITQLNDGKAQLEGNLEKFTARGPAAVKPSQQAQQQQRPAAPSTGDPVQDYIASRTPRTRDYLQAKDRSWVADPAMTSKLTRAHHAALGQGHVIESDSYFDFIDQEMGAKKAAAPAQMEIQPARKQAPAAPVTNKAASTPAPATSMKVRLTEGQVAAAKALGMSITEYAARVHKMSQPGWNGPRFGTQS